MTSTWTNNKLIEELISFFECYKKNGEYYADLIKAAPDAGVFNIDSNDIMQHNQSLFQELAEDKVRSRLAIRNAIIDIIQKNNYISKPFVLYFTEPFAELNCTIRPDDKIDAQPIENKQILPPETYNEQLSIAYDRLKQTIENNFPGKFSILEACLSVKAQLLIEGITQVTVLILIGNPSSYKTTILEIVSSLPDCYVSDKFTPKSFVSHYANSKKEELAKIDLLPRIKHKTLVTPELAPLFAGQTEQLIDNFGILTRVLDGRGLQIDTGVHGRRGYEGDYSFMWIGAVVDVPHRVWKVFSNLGPKVYFLRIPKDNKSDFDKKESIKKSILENNYQAKLEASKRAINEFWEIFLKGFDSKFNWQAEKDDPEVFDKIIILAQVLGKLRASIPTWHTIDSSGSNYNFEMPIIEDASRASNVLYNLARGHAALKGRNYITKDDLGIVISVALSSAPRERVELFKLLVENGKINTDQFIEQSGASRVTALKEMQHLTIVGLVDKLEEDAHTKPIISIQLKQEFQWFNSEEFKLYWKRFKESHTPRFFELSSNSGDNSEKNRVCKEHQSLDAHLTDNKETIVT